MRKALFEVAAAVAAAAIAFAVIGMTADLDPWIKWTVVAGAAVVAFGVAASAGRRLNRQSSGQSVAVGTDIKSGDRVNLTDIKANSTKGQRTEIGTRIRSKRGTDIKGIDVRGDGRVDKPAEG